MECMKDSRNIIRYFLFGFILFCINSHQGVSENPLVVVQISDPQIGFYHENGDHTYEIDRFSAAVEKVNKLKPDYVIFTGDLINNTDSCRQQVVFDSLASTLNESIKTLYIPGNHDVKIVDGSVDMSMYMSKYKYDRFVKIDKDVLLIGLNSVLIKDEKNDKLKEDEQYEWLKSILKENEKVKTKLVFVHHPFYLNKIDEPNSYMVIDQYKRAPYFELFSKYSVNCVFAGHLHNNSYAEPYEGVGMITTSALVRQLGQAVPGVRVIVVNKGEIQSKYYKIEEIPENRKEIIF